MLRMTNAGGQRASRGSNIGTGWTFESDGTDLESEGEKQDGDYLYFGYWLNSPVVSQFRSLGSPRMITQFGVYYVGNGSNITVEILQRT